MISEATSTPDDLSIFPAVQAEHFEVIFVDFLMLGVTGFEIAAAVRSCG
jgi:hypothetical protein